MRKRSKNENENSSRSSKKYVRIRSIEKTFCKGDFLIRGILQDYDDASITLLVLFHADLSKNKVKKIENIDDARSYTIGISKSSCKKCDLKNWRLGNGYSVVKIEVHY